MANAEEIRRRAAWEAKAGRDREKAASARMAWSMGRYLMQTYSTEQHPVSYLWQDDNHVDWFWTDLTNQITFTVRERLPSKDGRDYVSCFFSVSFKTCAEIGVELTYGAGINQERMKELLPDYIEKAVAIYHQIVATK